MENAIWGMRQLDALLPASRIDDSGGCMHLSGKSNVTYILDNYNYTKSVSLDTFKLLIRWSGIHRSPLINSLEQVKAEMRLPEVISAPSLVASCVRDMQSSLYDTSQAHSVV